MQVEISLQELMNCSRLERQACQGTIELRKNIDSYEKLGIIFLNTITLLFSKITV
jgi:hypothetical protein